MTSRSDDGRAWYTSEVAPHLDAVYRYFVRRAPAQDADDLTAEVFEIAWRRRDDVPEAHILPWLYRTAGFVLANHRRRAKALPLHLVSEPLDEDHAHRIADRDELSRALALAGADVIATPAAWFSGEHKVDHWRTLLKARAVENTVWIAAADTCSEGTVGHSAVVDPLAVAVAELGEEPEAVATAEVTRERIAEVRESLPVLANRRTDLG